MRMTEKVSLLLRSLSDSRFRNDVKALKFAADGYVLYAWNLCKDVSISELLKEGATIDEITKRKNIKNKKMLECVLDILVGNEVLEYKNNKYSFLKEPKSFDNELVFLQKFYPKSVEWTNALLSRSKKTLLTGEKHFDTSFDHEKFLELWDGIMKESPYSFRKIAINKFSNKLKDDNEILDLGCGSGTSLEQILLECKNKINLTGVDASQISLDKAKIRVRELYEKIKDPTVKDNINRLKLLKHDLTKNFPKNIKYDVIFMSLLINHIPEEYREKFFRDVKSLLKNNGIVVIYQIINKSKFERAAMWVMHVIPTHQEYPFKEEYINMLNKVFNNVKYYLDGVIVVAK